MHAFGSGVVWGTPLTDANGAAIANPTPVMCGVLQDVSVDISFDTKQLYGQQQFPVAIARGKGKIDIKAKMGKINGATLNNLFFGQTVSAGAILNHYDVVGTAIPASTPFTITPTVPSSGTWQQDLGVMDASGNLFTRVASSPTTGQYSVSAGVYTFATADAGKMAFISYNYSATSTVAQKSTIMNLPMGAVPSIRLDLANGFGGKGLSLSFFNCVSSKLQLGTKLDDFMIPEMDFSAFADPLGRVGQWSTAE